MKRLIYILPVAALLLNACSSNDAVDKDGNTVSSEFTKDIELPENPCELITKKMVTSNYDVTADEVELADDNSEGYSRFESCSYTWKKENYKELKEKRTDLIMSSMGANSKKGAKKASMSDVLKMESPINKLGVGNFRKFEDMQKALTMFTNLHHVPTKEDMKKLDKEIDKQADKKGVGENAKKQGKKLTGGIASNLKFTKVDGIGDQAFYDHLDKSLDVRFGTICFSLYISTENGLEKDIEVGKELAKEIWSKL